jgi:hypothetical protein
MLIYGWKQYVKVLSVLILVCGQCSMPAEHVVRRFTTKFTLFFVPLFPIGRRHTMFCAGCQAETKISRQQAEQLVMSGDGRPAPPAPPQPVRPMPQPQQAYGQHPQFHSGPQPVHPPMPGPYGQTPPGPPMPHQHQGPPVGHPPPPNGYPYQRR